MPKNPEVDAFLKREKQWRSEFTRLRALLLESGLEEALKWGKPCYALEGKNVALIHGFKDYCAILFHKGSLLADPEGLLVQQTPNVQAARQLRFTSLKDVNARASSVRAFVQAAIEAERSGREVAFKQDFERPAELTARLAADPKLEKAFAGLTPGRQRGYILHFAQPKQAKTRESRVLKHAPRILKGLGLDD